MAGALAIAIATSGATVGAGGSPATGSAEVRSRSTDSGTAVSRDAGPTRSSAGAAPECPPNAKPVGGGCIPKGTAHVVHGERCRSARLAVSHYRALTWERQKARQGALADRTPVVRGKTCRWARYAADEWLARARSARLTLNRWRRLISNPTRAICFVFGPYCSQALRVASCESGRGIYAQNGQYLGMFQMGDYARSRYGHSYTALGQARAAYAYFVDSGRDWSPWSCKP